MASYRKKKGSRNWYYRYVDENGDQHEKAGSPDRRETELLAAAVEREVARIKAGVYSAEDLERKKRRNVPVAGAISDFLASKRSISTDSKGMLKSYLDRFVAECQIKVLADITPAKIEKFFAGVEGRYEGGGTANRWWSSLVSFLKWCRRRKLIDSLATDEVEKPAPWVGRKDRRRRALTDAEFDAIIGAIESAKSRWKLPNSSWAWMVRIARFTGLRRKEIWSLTKESFRGMDSPSPFILCEAGDTKNGDEARQPIPRFLVPSLSAWLSTQADRSRLFVTTHYTAKRLRGDLVRAGVAAATAEGRIDFHSLRVTYVTWLVRSNANVRVTQALARHGDPRLTFNVYAKLNPLDLREAVEGASLPFQSPTGTQETSLDSAALCESSGGFEFEKNGGPAKTSGHLRSELKGRSPSALEGLDNRHLVSSKKLAINHADGAPNLTSPDLEELVGIWNALKPAPRKALLAAARRLGRKP